MAKPLSNDLRERAVGRHEAGGSTRSVGSAFGVAPSTVSKWAQRQRETGSVEPAQFGGYRRRVLEPHRETVHALVSEAPHRSVRALRDELAGLGIAVCEETLRKFLHAEGLSFKKNRVRN